MRPAVGFHLDQRLQPDHPARAVAHQRQPSTPGARPRPCNGLGNLIGTKGNGGAVQRNVNLHFATS